MTTTGCLTGQVSTNFGIKSDAKRLELAQQYKARGFSSFRVAHRHEWRKRYVVRPW